MHLPTPISLRRARSYLAFWFWFDLVSSLPFDWFVEDGLLQKGFSFEVPECQLGPDLYELLSANASGIGGNGTVVNAGADLSVTSQTFSFFKSERPAIAPKAHSSSTSQACPPLEPRGSAGTMSLPLPPLSPSTRRWRARTTPAQSSR